MAHEDYKDDVNFGDIMTVEAFKSAVEDGSFIDYDGFAHPAIVKQDSTKNIWPSRIEQLPEDATHVVWFNK